MYSNVVLTSCDRQTPQPAVGGNCGVGFAPCRPEHRALLVSVMEGVEDIPEVVMTEGLTWDWQTYPEYLNAIEKRPHDIDFASQIPHSAVRVFVSSGWTAPSR